MDNENIELVKGLLDKFLAGDDVGYIDGCHEEFHGIYDTSGLIPGGGEIKGKEELTKMFGLIPEYVDMKKFESVDWRCVDNEVYFTVNVEFIWKPTEKLVKTIANVKKIIVDNKIKEKYHIVSFQDIVS